MNERPRWRMLNDNEEPPAGRSAHQLGDGRRAWFADLDDELEELEAGAVQEPTSLDIALALAATGLPVFPCNAAKRPAIPKARGGNGFHDATVDPDRIRELWALAGPAATLVGVPTGAASGFDVLDSDPRHGSDDWRTANIHRLPETRIHATMNGGEHWLFRHVDGVRNGASKIAPGIDVRGAGGYIIMPPSAGYSVIHESDIADWPDWLLPIVVKVAEPAPRPDPSRYATPAKVSDNRLRGWIDREVRRVRDAPAGGRHDARFVASRSIGGIAAEAGLTDPEAEEILIGARPPEVEELKERRAIRDGLASGRAAPIDLNALPESAQFRGHQQHHGNGASRDGPGGGDTEQQDELPPLVMPLPDMAVLRLNRRPPPALPLEVFGPHWEAWIRSAAAAAAAPPDYVVAPLLASASVLIGNARWAQATPGWAEPPHLWCGGVGDSGNGKSPGGDALMMVLTELERRMALEYPDQLREWRAAAEVQNAKTELWKAEVKEATKKGFAPPEPPAEQPDEPQRPRLRQSDITIEKVAELLANAAPKGMLITRDELAGWFKGLAAYNESGRAFWIESYGGRQYIVERKKLQKPIVVPHLVVGVYGGTQPDKLAELTREADDGMLARFLWFWPDPIPFDLTLTAPAIGWATAALDRLRLLEMLPATPDAPARPVMVPLTAAAYPALVKFAREMQAEQVSAYGLMRSELGKGRGHVLRLSLVLELLWWSAADGTSPPPTTISEQAFAAACCFMADYAIPMAERTYGDAAAKQQDRNAAMLARWILKNRPLEVNTRLLMRKARIPGLVDAETAHEACLFLVDAGWLFVPTSAGKEGRPRASYSVNPRVWEAS